MKAWWQACEGQNGTEMVVVAGRLRKKVVVGVEGVHVVAQGQRKQKGRRRGVVSLSLSSVAGTQVMGTGSVFLVFSGTQAWEV